LDEDRREEVSAIDALEAVDGTADFCRLHEWADRYFALPDAADQLDVWFRLYERFPNTDAGYAFWSPLPFVCLVSGTLWADDVPFRAFALSRFRTKKRVRRTTRSATRRPCAPNPTDPLQAGGSAPIAP
jgi:hypothetical protein